jgi:cysteine desulfurase
MGKNQFITAATDEAPAIMSIGRLEQFSCLGKMAPVNPQGQVTAHAIAETLTPRTALVSLSWANGLTGVINPIEEIAALCNDRGVRLHLDATHTLGKLFFQSGDIPGHFISFNGDNLHAPKGTGGLFIKGDLKCSPFIVGGVEQAGHRAGSFNIAGLAALGEAAREALDARDLVCTEVARLRSHFEAGVLEAVPDSMVFFQDVERVPNSKAIAFPGISNEALLYTLNRGGVYGSIGGGSYQQIGLLLMASGIEECVAHSSVSFSLSRETTEEQIDQAIDIIAEAVQRLRKVSQQLVKEV